MPGFLRSGHIYAYNREWYRMAGSFCRMLFCVLYCGWLGSYENFHSRDNAVFSPGIQRRIGPIRLPFGRRIGQYAFFAVLFILVRAKHNWRGCGHAEMTNALACARNQPHALTSKQKNGEAKVVLERWQPSVEDEANRNQSRVERLFSLDTFRGRWHRYAMFSVS